LFLFLFLFFWPVVCVWVSEVRGGQVGWVVVGAFTSKFAEGGEMALDV